MVLIGKLFFFPIMDMADTADTVDTADYLKISPSDDISFRVGSENGIITLKAEMK
ncbi:hypothetical protein FACS1894111_09020 [Clostridia bacterium]|nr:hypothetical protein FACS1894111_09020 [Clostridia bacterium]